MLLGGRENNVRLLTLRAIVALEDNGMCATGVPVKKSPKASLPA